MSILSENILMIRGELSQEEFGKLIKANKNKVYTYERSDKPTTPKAPTLQRIADYAGITIDQLINKKLKEVDLTIQSNSGMKVNDAGGLILENQIELMASNRVILSILANIYAPSAKKMPMELEGTFRGMVKDEAKRVRDELQQRS